MPLRTVVFSRLSAFVLGASLIAASNTGCAEEKVPAAPGTATSEQVIPAEAVAPSAWPAALAVVERGGGRIVGSFDAGHGLQGWYVQKGINVQVVYTSLDGDLLLIGSVLNANGDNLTRDQMADSSRFADFSVLWQQLTDSATVSFGPARSELYIVFEPHCHYCHVLWDELKKIKGASFNLFPVAFRQDALYLSAALLQEKDKTKVVETYFDKQASMKLAAKYADSPSELLDKVEANIDFMKSVEINGTPALIWKDQEGKVHFQQGAVAGETLKQILLEATR